MLGAEGVVREAETLFSRRPAELLLPVAAPA
jgi:hypothetical protein